jgi:hypothetical protein
MARVVSLKAEAEQKVPKQLHRGCSVFVLHIFGATGTDVTLDRPKLERFE